MDQMLWILSPELFDYQPFDEIVEYIKARGDEVIITKGRPVEQQTKINKSWPGPVMSLVTIQWARWIQRTTKLTPGVIFRPNELNIATFTTHWYDHCLNHPIFLPWGQLLKKKDDLQWMYYNPKFLFMRSDSSQKIFPGQLVNMEDLEYEVNSYSKVTSVVAETMMAISPVEIIYDEWRFWIIENKIISWSGSTGDPTKELTTTEPTTEILDLLNTVMKSGWTPDIGYTIDLAITSKGPKIIEANALSTSGFYQCDWKKVVDGLVILAQNEFY